MARTAITVFDLSSNALTGTEFDANKTAGIADGHKCLNNGDVFFLITKSTTSGAVTFISDGTAGPGKYPITDPPYTIETTDNPKIVGPFDPGVCNQKSDPGYIYWDYESGEETEFDVYPIKMVAAR